MAQVLPGLTIAPFPPGLESLDNALREWRRGFGEVTSESEAASPAFSSARRGALDIREQGTGIKPNSNKTRQAVDKARPNAEIGKAQEASGNDSGVNAKIRKAEGSAQDPNAPVPDFDPNDPLRDADPQIKSLEERYRDLNAETQAAQDAECEYNN